MNQPFLDAGYDVEALNAGIQDRLPRENLICSGNFDFKRAGFDFDFAIAQSLFSHLTLNHIRICLENLAKIMKVGGVFCATFFNLPSDSSFSTPHTHSPGGVTTHGDADPYHYWLSDMFHAAAYLPWRVELGRGWNHPRGQKMLLFTRIEGVSPDVR
jgi:hypothetical protein